MTFFIWTPTSWKAFCAGSHLYEYPIATRCLEEAQEEYGCGLIVTMLWAGRHKPIKPVTVH